MENNIAAAQQLPPEALATEPGATPWEEVLTARDYDAQSLIRQVRQKVDLLPQRDLIREHDAKFWSEEVVHRYGDLALWHVARAGGFGGSQIGALVRNHMGLRADHSSAHDIVEGALLRRLPDEPNGQMRRGVWMEPHHREMFYEKWGARRDEQGFKLLTSSVGMRPWMRYSPDELCFMSGAVLGLAADKPVRILGDFKAPTTTGSVNFEYQCQLAMGNLICKHVGLQVDALMLSQFDWANWEMNDQWVESSEELEKAIVGAGDYYWYEFVMKGVVPRYVAKPRFDDAGALDKIRGDMSDMAKLKTLASYVTRLIEDLDKKIRPAIAEYRLGNEKLSLGGLNYSASPELDMEKVAAALPLDILDKLPLKPNSTKAYDEDLLKAKVRAMGQHLGMKASEINKDLKDCLKPANLDPEAVRAALEQAGLDADAMVKEKLTARVDTTAAAQVMPLIEAQVSQLLGRGKADVEALAANDALDEAAEELEGEERDSLRVSGLHS